MNRIDRDSLAEIEFQLRWQSRDAEHTDASVRLVNFWRDWLPGAVFEELMGAPEGERKTFRFPPPPRRPANTVKETVTGSNPEAVFRDAARILKPGGKLVHTFSNRWFPPKAIRLWTELHEFERMGLVLDYFQRSGQFTDLATFSSSGWDRPESDKYYPDMPQSDPVFAVWGTRI